MIIKVAILCFTILACFDTPADVPGGDPYREIENDEFDKYFSFLYSKMDGGDLALKLSPSFIESFQSDDCLLFSLIEIFNTEGDITKWAQLAGMKLINLNPDIAAQQVLVVGGLGYKLRIKLMYSVSGCEPLNPEHYKSQDRIIFRFDDITELGEREQTF